MKGKEKEQLYQKRNYDHYRFSMKELLKYMGQALALCIMADYLFYKSRLEELHQQERWWTGFPQLWLKQG